MITCRWSIACEHAVVDRYTNNVSLLHIIDQITVRVPPEPASPIPISLDVDDAVGTWRRGITGVRGVAHGNRDSSRRGSQPYSDTS